MIVGCRQRRRPLRIVALGAAIAAATPAFAQTAVEQGGDARAALAGRGVTFAVNYIGDVLVGVSGGLDRGVFYDGRAELAITADLGKLAGLNGLSFFVNGYQIHGESISADHLGSLMPASNIEARPATRLFELWLEQKLFDDKLSIRMGQLAADSEFLLSEGGAAFLNGTWGWPSITGANMPGAGPAYPLATPGVRVAFNPTEQVGILVGLFNGNPAGDCPPERLPEDCNRHGLDFPLGEPPLLMVEGAFKHSRGEGQLPGTIKLGGYHNFGDFAHQRLDSNGVPTAVSGQPGRLIDGDYGIYAVIDQMIYRVPGAGDGKGVAVFGRVVGAPFDRNLVDIYWEAGLTFSGLMAERPKDVLGIGFAYTGISDEHAAAHVDLGHTVIPTHEAVLEVSYIAHVLPGLAIQPDFQYFWNPGAHTPRPDDPTSPVPNAAVLGVRTTVNY